MLAWPVGAFVVIPVVLALLLALGVATAWIRSGASTARARRVTLITLVITVVWMEATWMAASNGILREWHRTPPPIMLLLCAIVAVAVGLAFSPVGRRLATYVPLWVLVLVQVFRFPLELAIHAMYMAGVAPVQMTYSGRNFDIITGISALLVARFVASGRAGRGLVLIWNVVGLALLINVVTVAVLGTPRFQYFGPKNLNVWVAYTPYVWLPAVMVLAALTGHLLIFRALWPSRAALPPSRDPRGRTPPPPTRTA